MDATPSFGVTIISKMPSNPQFILTWIILLPFLSERLYGNRQRKKRAAHSVRHGQNSLRFGIKSSSIRRTFAILGLNAPNFSRKFSLQNLNEKSSRR